MLSEHRNLAAAKRFFRSAKAVTGVIPDRVTTDGHDAYPQAIRTELGSRVRHRTKCYLNNRLEQGPGFSTEWAPPQCACPDPSSFDAIAAKRIKLI